MPHILSRFFRSVRSKTKALVANKHSKDPEASYNSSSSRALPTGNIYAIGLFTTTDFHKTQSNRWIGADRTFWSDLLSSVTHSWWFSAVESVDESWKIIFGDLDLQKGHFQPPTTLDRLPLEEIWTQFILKVQDISSRATCLDKLVFVLCGHGEEDRGSILLGDGLAPVLKSDVEAIIRDTPLLPENLFVISTACFSVHWKSDLWTLLGSDNEVFTDENHASVDALSPCPGSRLSVNPAQLAPLALDERVSLLRLSMVYNSQLHLDTEVTLKLNRLTKMIVSGESVDLRDQRDVLCMLRYLVRANRRATLIAERLGWTPLVAVEDWVVMVPNNCSAMQEAEDSGVAVFREFLCENPEGAVLPPRIWRTIGPGRWLANVWVHENRPKVDESVWNDAVAYATRKVDEEGYIS